MPERTSTSPVFRTTMSPTATLPVIALANEACVCALLFLTTSVL